MSPTNELHSQLLSLCYHIHSSHIEDYMKTTRINSLDIYRSPNLQALLNQNLLEYFDLRISESDFTGSFIEDFQSWPFPYIALIPMEILNKTLTLWAACVHAEKINNFIDKNDIAKMKNFFSDNYHWLSAPTLNYPEHPKERLQQLITNRQPIMYKPKISVDDFFNIHLSDTSYFAAHTISSDWPKVLKNLLILKLPYQSNAIKYKELNNTHIDHYDFKNTFINCLKRVSREWHGIFSIT